MDTHSTYAYSQHNSCGTPWHFTQTCVQSPTTCASPISTCFPATPMLDVQVDAVPFSETLSELMKSPLIKYGSSKSLESAAQVTVEAERANVPNERVDESFFIEHIRNLNEYDPYWNDDDIDEIVLLSPKRRSQLYVHDRLGNSRQTVDIPGYELIRVIDTESGTRTFLAQNSNDSKVYMIKCIRKHSLMTTGAVKRALAEQQCLKLTTQLSLPFLPRLYRSFHDRDQLVMVMDHYPGGDLLTALLSNNQMSTENCRFYASEIIDALAFLHSLNIVHRNVRAENVWIQGDGHVVLGNFGYAKELSPPTSARTRTSSSCGSREQQPPEMILGWGYDFSVDCWGFGILISLLHFGRHPFGCFDGADPLTAVQTDILRELSQTSSRDVPDAACDLIAQCLERNPVLRITSQIMKTHPYFRGVDWYRLRLKGYKAPFVPTADVHPFGVSQSSAGVHRQNYDCMHDDGFLPGLDGNLFADYSFSWAPNACFINEPAPTLTKPRLSKQYVSVLQKPEATSGPNASLRKVRSILKEPSQKYSGVKEVAEPGIGLETKPNLRRSPSAYSEFSRHLRSRRSADNRSSLQVPHKQSRTSIISKRLSLSSLFNDAESSDKRKRNKLRKRSRQSLCIPQAVSHETLNLPPGVTQSGRGIGYSFNPHASRSLTQLGTKKCFSVLGALLGGKNMSAENLPRSRDDVMQHIYGSNWSVAHTTEAMMSTANFGIPEGLGQRVDSIDGGYNFATTTIAPKRSIDLQLAAVGGYN